MNCFCALEWVLSSRAQAERRMLLAEAITMEALIGAEMYGGKWWYAKMPQSWYKVGLRYEAGTKRG
jgi:hypothetical protein